MDADMGTTNFTFYAPNRAEDCRQFVEWSAHTGWQTDYQQLGKGVFDGSLTIAHAGEIGVHRCVFNHELLIYASPPQGSVALVIPYSTGRRGVVQGHELVSEDVIVVPTGAEGFLRTAPNLSYYDVVVPQTSLVDWLRKNDPAIDVDFRSGGVMRFPRSVMRKLQSQLRATVEQGTDEPSTIMELLVQGMSREMEAIPGPNRLRRRFALVRKARTYIEDRLAHDITVTDVVAVLRVSRRTLESAFRDVLELSPLAYIRSRQMNAVRRELRDNREQFQQGGILELAQTLGLRHAGYFSRNYKSLFGELPSETVQGKQD